MIRKPIPGQSLTLAPKQYAWERPPEIVDPEQAIIKHLDRLSEPERLENLLATLEFGEMDIHTLTKGIIRGAVANGVHSIDVGLLVAPVVHEYIKQAANAYGIKAEDGFVDKEAKDKKKQQLVSIQARKMLAEAGVKPKEDVKEIKAAVEEVPAVAEKPMPTKGLMARGGV